jgi:hypothetical protein
MNKLLPFLIIRNFLLGIINQALYFVSSAALSSCLVTRMNLPACALGKFRAEADRFPVLYFHLYFY